MNKEAVRRLTVPYGVVVVPEHAAFAFFNREYEPLGVPRCGTFMSDEHRLSWYLDNAMLRRHGMSDIQDKLGEIGVGHLVQMNVSGYPPFKNATTFRLFFYNDGCVPTDSKKGLKEYTERLNAFLEFVGDNYMKNVFTERLR